MDRADSGLRELIENDCFERMHEMVEIELTVDSLLDYEKRNVLNPEMNLQAILEALALRTKELMGTGEDEENQDDD